MLHFIILLPLAGCGGLETRRLLRAVRDGSHPIAQVQAGTRLGEIGTEKIGRALSLISTDPEHTGQDAAFIGLLKGIEMKRWTRADMDRWEDEALSHNKRLK